MQVLQLSSSTTGSQKAWDFLNLARATAYYVSYWKSQCTAENVLSQQTENQGCWIFIWLYSMFDVFKMRLKEM